MPNVIATPGADGHKIESLFRHVREQGAEELHGIAEGMAKTMIRKGEPKGMPERDIAKLTTILTNANATANLMGRAKVRKRANRMTKFSEATDWDWVGFAEGEVFSAMTPMNALEYFLKLAPIASINPGTFDATQQGQAFNLAATTNENLLTKIWKVIAEFIATGKNLRGKPKEIEEILAQANIHPRKGYGELVMRTNVMESYRAGAQEEFSNPTLDTTFPTWQYMGIDDGRERPAHHLRFGRFFDRSIPFKVARGNLASDCFNCRCDAIPIYFRDWERLQEQGAVLSDPNELNQMVASGLVLG